MRRVLSVSCRQISHQLYQRTHQRCFCTTKMSLCFQVPHSTPQFNSEGIASNHGGGVDDSGVRPKAQEKRGDNDITITDHTGLSKQVKPLAFFKDISDIPNWLAEGLRNQGYPSTTVIQKYTIPVLEEGHDVIGLAPTGSGKTVAFAVPALKKMRRNDDGSPCVLVLAPTRELVQQTTKVFEALSQDQVRVCEAYGGAPREVQARKLHRGCDVLVACPGRLKDFLEGGDVCIKNLSFIVFDEADRLLDMGFQIQLDDILSYIDPSVRPQTMMWSATWPSSVQELARNYLSKDRLLIRAGTAGTGQQVNDHISQHILFASTRNERVEKLVSLIESGKINDNTDKLIIFVERQADTEGAAHALSERLGIDSRFVGAIHGGLSQRQRDAVLGRFKNNYIRLLVATDVASRGLDIPDVTCVVNFQAPKNIDSYCHRIGRTGRAGRKGNAYTFLDKDDAGISQELIDYLRLCNMDVPQQLAEMAREHEEERNSRRYSKNRWGNRSGDRSRSFSSSRQSGFQRSRPGGSFGTRGSGRRDSDSNQDSGWTMATPDW